MPIEPPVTATERIRDADRTRADILEVATDEFAARGYTGARVDEIAARTRTTKRMIYYYFGNKEKLFVAVLEHAYARIRESEQRLQIEGLEPVDALRRYAEGTYDHHTMHQNVIRLVGIENIHDGHHINQSDSIKSLGMPVVDLIGEILQRGRERGEFRVDVDPVDVHMLISAYCVFPINNRHTFGALFDRDLLEESRRDHYRTMLGDAVVAWMTDV